MQRAKLLLILDDRDEDGGRKQMWIDGWARLEGQWVSFLDDEECRWSTWPLQHVRCIEWAEPVIEEDYGREVAT